MPKLISCFIIMLLSLQVFADPQTLSLKPLVTNFISSIKDKSAAAKVAQLVILKSKLPGESEHIFLSVKPGKALTQAQAFQIADLHEFEIYLIRVEYAVRTQGLTKSACDQARAGVDSEHHVDDEGPADASDEYYGAFQATNDILAALCQ